MPDPLSDVMSQLHVDRARLARMEAHGKWSLSFPARRQISFGATSEGRMLLLPEGHRKPFEIAEGDCYLLTKGQPYRVASDLNAPTQDGLRTLASARGEDSMIRFGRGDPRVVWVGSSFSLSDRSSDTLLDLLPPVIHLPGASVNRAPLRAVFNLLEMELLQAKPGKAAIMASLAHILIIEILRVMLSRSTRSSGWLGALMDERMAHALAAMHRDHARHWTVEDLAAEAGMSRTAFAVGFKKLVGLPPLQYLTQWRMALASNALRDGDHLSTVARKVGYASDTAFSLAFKRATGHSPGRFRSM